MQTSRRQRWRLPSAVVLTSPRKLNVLQEAPPLPSAEPDPHYEDKPRGLSCAAAARKYRRAGRGAAKARLAAKQVRARCRR